jgi:hypothetical protein
MFQNYFENFIAIIQISEYKYNSTSGDMLKVFFFFFYHPRFYACVASKAIMIKDDKTNLINSLEKSYSQKL